MFGLFKDCFGFGRGRREEPELPLLVSQRDDPDLFRLAFEYSESFEPTEFADALVKEYISLIFSNHYPRERYVTPRCVKDYILHMIVLLCLDAQTDRTILNFLKEEFGDLNYQPFLEILKRRPAFPETDGLSNFIKCRYVFKEEFTHLIKQNIFELCQKYYKGLCTYLNTCYTRFDNPESLPLLSFDMYVSLIALEKLEMPLQFIAVILNKDGQGDSAERLHKQYMKLLDYVEANQSLSPVMQRQYDEVDSWNDGASVCGSSDLDDDPGLVLEIRPALELVL